MSREQFIKDKIKQNGFNIKEFAKKIDMPYSTLLSMLNGSIGGAAIDNVIKVCKGLEITVSELEDDCKNIYLAQEEAPTKIDENFSSEEQVIIKKYRSLDENGKEAVNAILEINYKRCFSSTNKAEFSEHIC